MIHIIEYSPVITLVRVFKKSSRVYVHPKTIPIGIENFLKLWSEYDCYFILSNVKIYSN